MRRTLFGLFVIGSVLTLLSVQPHAQTVTPKVERVEYDMEKLVVPPALSDTQLKGRSLFTQRCAYCHEQRGVINIGNDHIEATGEANARQRILEGLPRQMPGFQYTLELSQVDQILAFLKTVTKG